VKFRRVIERKLRGDGKGVQAAGDVNAVVSANFGESRGTVSKTSSRQSTRVVQRGAKKEESE
jgi:hypothetical protein